MVKKYVYVIGILVLVLLISLIWGYANKDEGKLTVKYRPDSKDFTKQVRLFDPPIKELERYTPPYTIGEKCYSSYDSVNKIMTDTSCLQFKTETNGVITINDERYLAFGLKGTIDGNEIKKTSMDFSWTWHVEEDNGDYVFWAENDNPNFIWRQYYYFYEDYSKPMKIEHYLENNLNDITNAQMYYLTNVLPTDEIEYNETRYLVSDYMGLHKQGNFNDLVSTINFNAEYDFNFEDLVDDGFEINEFYIGSGSVIGKPNVNITAVGFTKNNGNFPKGSSVWIDPTFTTEYVESVSVTPLSDDKMVVAWGDESADDREFQLYYTNGTAIGSQVTVDSSAGSPSYTSISVTALNSTHFVVAWFDNADNIMEFSVYNTAGTLIIGPIIVDDAADDGYSISVSAFNETTFVVGWFDSADDDASFRIYDSSGSPLTGIIDADEAVGGTCLSVSVSALSETTFVIGWADDADDYTQLRIYNSAGTALTTAKTVDTGVGTSRMVSVSALSETTLVIGWLDQANQDVLFKIYNSAGTALITTKTADNDVGNSFYISVSAMNSSQFVIGWYDIPDTDHEFAIYNTAGTLIAGPTISSTIGLSFQTVSSYQTATDIGFCDQNFIHAFAVSTTQADWIAYYPNGTVWDGVCPPVADTTPPYFTDGTPTNQTIDNVTALSYDVNASDETALSGFIIDDTTNFTINFASGLLTNKTQLKVGYHPINVTINDTSNNKNSTVMSVNVTEAVLDTCTCPGAGNNWEVNMEDMCNLTTACTLTTGNLTWTGSSGYFNCSENLNISNRDAPPSSTTFYHSDGCDIIYLIILLTLSTTKFKRKKETIIK